MLSHSQYEGQQGHIQDEHKFVCIGIVGSPNELLLKDHGERNVPGKPVAHNYMGLFQ